MLLGAEGTDEQAALAGVLASPAVDSDRARAVCASDLSMAGRVAS